MRILSLLQQNLLLHLRLLINLLVHIFCSGENPWLIWSRNCFQQRIIQHSSMTKALSAKSNLGFVDGSILEPSNPDSPLFQASWRCNDMVIYFMKFVKIQNVRYIQRNGQRLLELKKLSLSLSHSRFTNCWRAEVFVRRISQLLSPPCLSLWSYAGYW